MYNPPALLREGEVEIWDIQKRSGHLVGVAALDETLSWFPDGKRLAYTALVPRNHIPRIPISPDSFGSEFASWSRVPVVYILNIDSGKRAFLHVGWSPVVSTDGKKVVVSDFEYRWRTVDVATSRSTPASAPGAWEAPLALLKGDIVIYVGLPTEGANRRFTESNSPLVGPKPMLTVKAAKLNTRRFQTLIQYHDARMALSYGLAK